MKPVALFLLLAVLGGPLWAYVVILKDGNQIITREKYRQEDEKVFLVFPNGTETFIAASEVDFEKTDELNTINIGQARLIEQSADTVFVDEDEPEKDHTLSSLARETRLTLPKIGKRDTITENEGPIPYTSSGFVDLWHLHRASHPDAELTDEIQLYLESQGAVGFRTFKGSAEKRVLLEMTANSEAAVFKSLRDAASALVQTQTRFPDKIEALELVMWTDNKQQAGQFVLTREMADKYLSGAIDPTTFFYRHVQF